MSESGTVSADKPGTRQDTQKNDLGLFARIALFIRQVVAELRKVVTPTRSELVNYTIVVIVFVLVVMAFVGVLDFAIGKGVLWMFGRPTE